MVADTGTEQK